MDLDKSLYMANFLKKRSLLGTNYQPVVEDIFDINLYDSMKPKKKVKQVEEAVEEIQEKTIHLLKKDDQPAFFPDIPEIEPVDSQGIEEKVSEIKMIKISEPVDDKPPDSSELKKIIIDPKYVAKDD